KESAKTEESLNPTRRAIIRLFHRLLSIAGLTSGERETASTKVERTNSGMSCTFIALTLALALPADAPKVELLWPAGAPGAKGTEDADKPTLTIFLPPEGKANGAAVVVCPGGGYGGLAVDHEGKQIGEWLNQRGVTAFMLKYRHAPKYRH